MNKNPEDKKPAKEQDPELRFKTVFVIDSVKGERIYLAKMIKHESLFVMSFTGIQDCFKTNYQLRPDIIVYTLRKKPQDIKKLKNIRRKHKKIKFILYLTQDYPEINTADLQDDGFTSIFKAASQEKAREIVKELLSPESLPRRREIPHPVPYHIADISKNMN